MTDVSPGLTPGLLKPGSHVLPYHPSGVSPQCPPETFSPALSAECFHIESLGPAPMMDSCSRWPNSRYGRHLEDKLETTFYIWRCFSCPAALSRACLPCQPRPAECCPPSSSPPLVRAFLLFGLKSQQGSLFLSWRMRRGPLTFMKGGL